MTWQREMLSPARELPSPGSPLTPSSAPTLPSGSSDPTSASISFEEILSPSPGRDRQLRTILSPTDAGRGSPSDGAASPAELSAWAAGRAPTKLASFRGLSEGEAGQRGRSARAGGGRAGGGGGGGRRDAERQRRSARRDARRSGYERLDEYDEGDDEREDDGDERQSKDYLKVGHGGGGGGGAQEARLRTRSSVLLPSLEEWERRFFELVAAGDVGPVRDFLAQHSDFNINCVDYQGLSALHIAVRAGDEAMTEALLELEETEVGDCALHAAQAGNTRLLELLLERLGAAGAEREFAGCAGSPDFADGTTPLLLAAQKGHYDAIALLLARGHELQRPHGPSCACAEVCLPERQRTDRLATGAERLALYRAWVNPAFLCHSSDDPVLEAFRLCVELRQWAKEMPPLRAPFTDLSIEARAFAADLLGCCRTSREVRVLLGRRDGCDLSGLVDFPRLMLAVDLVQKEFVAHPNAQQVLEAAWTGDWAAWRSRSSFVKALYVLPRAVMLPVIAFMWLFVPHCRLSKHFGLPVNKYLSHVASYFIFLGLVFAESNIGKKDQKRGPPDSGLEPVLVVFVVGHIWGSIRLCLIQGPRRFFSVASNWFDALTQLLFASAFFFWGAAALDVAANEQRDLERKFWHALDPTLLGEGLFALAAILAFSRLMLLLQFSFHLGPLQVSLGKMIKDIAKFVVIFAIVMFAFAAGLCRLYEYYDGMSQKDPTGSTTTQISSFVSFTSTLKTLFWAIFCMSPVEVGDVVIEELPSEEGAPPVLNDHYFTAGVGHLCFALFMVFSVIVLLNMLIATICNTFQKVTDNVDVEWTFGRTEVYLVYLAQSTLPPPLNLLPTPNGLCAVGRWFSLLGKAEKGGGGGRARCSPAHCCFVEEPPPDEQQQRDYAAVLAQLAQRYFRERDVAAEAAAPAGAEIDALRKEVANLREGLLYALEPDPRVRASMTRGSRSGTDFEGV